MIAMQASSLFSLVQRASPCHFAQVLRAFCQAEPEEIALLLQHGFFDIVDYYLDKMYYKESVCSHSKNTPDSVSLEKILGGLEDGHLQGLWERRVSASIKQGKLAAAQARLSYFQALASKKKLRLFSYLAKRNHALQLNAVVLLSILKKRNAKKVLQADEFVAFQKRFSFWYQNRKEVRQIFTGAKELKIFLDELYKVEHTNADSKKILPQNLIDEMTTVFHEGLLHAGEDDARFVNHAGTRYFSLDYLYEKIFPLEEHTRAEMLRLFETDTVAKRMVYHVELSILRLLHQRQEGGPVGAFDRQTPN